MADTSSYDKAIDSVIAKFSPQKEKGIVIKQLIDYAETLGLPEGNIFLRHASQRLGFQTIRLNKCPIDCEEGTQVNVGVYDNGGVVIHANEKGLCFLSAILQYIADSYDEEDRVHLKVGANSALAEDSWPFSILKVKVIPSIESKDQIYGQGYQFSSQNDMNPNEIVAFQVFDELPPELQMTRGKIYRVKRMENDWPEPAWGREPLEDEESYYFLFDNDASEETVLRLCLDDETVNFLTAKHIEQI